MKVLFNCNVPFMLAHGGAQIQIEQTRTALEQLGVSVEMLRWWDDQQRGEVLHHFGGLKPHLVRLARDKGFKVVISPFITGLGARPRWRLALQKLARKAVKTLGPRGVSENFVWDSLRLAHGCVAMTPWEGKLVQTMFGVAPERIHVVPNGVEDVFFNSKPTTRGRWLVCTATIVEMKQVLKLAQMAVKAATPLWVIGKAYAEGDDYAHRFADFARENAAVVRYEGAISDRGRLAEVYREARGFVLLSRWEGLSLSALEAAACGCPLLLSDLPWAHSAFGTSVSYCPADASIEASAGILRRFYDAAPGLSAPPQPLSWRAVAQQLLELYQRLAA